MKLPPLKSLPVFIAVAKFKHFAKAANSLNVSPGAVSQQIKLLEEYLGCSLLVRDTKHVELTGEGQRYFESIDQAFQQIMIATDKIKPSNQATIQIRLLSTLAMLWLIPKLNDLYCSHPDISINLMAASEAETSFNERADLVIEVSKKKPNITAQKLWLNELVLIYNPDFFSKDTISKAQAVIVNHSSRDQDWPLYCKITGFVMPDKIYSMSSTIQAIESVKNGLGIFVTHLPLVAPLLESADFDMFNQPVATDDSYYLVDYNPHNPFLNKKIVKDWLLEQAQGYL